MSERRVLNIYGGPGVGKSTVAAAVFAELKFRGLNVELVTEYAKELAWEGDLHSLRLQDHVTGEQHRRLARVASKVDLVIMDSPLLLGSVYLAEDLGMPSLKKAFVEAYKQYNNFDVLLGRDPQYYKIAGRVHTAEDAKKKDAEIMRLLVTEDVPFHLIAMGRHAPGKIIKLLEDKEWI